jgi:hypothetical protein
VGRPRALKAVRGEELKKMAVKKETKEEREMRIFSEFAEAAKFGVDRGSIQNEKPPKPDIGCTIGGQRYYFELGE